MTIQPSPTDTRLLELDASGMPPVVVMPIVRTHRDDCTRDHKALAVAAARADRPQTTLAWGRQYLPRYFTKPASLMHEWLAAQLDSCRAVRSSKVNLVGPRGSAKSTIATLCYVLRMAVEGYEPYIWIVSDTNLQAQLHLENVKRELTSNELLALDYPEAFGCGLRWRRTFIELPNRVVIESIGTGQKIRGRRDNCYRPSLIVCDDLQNDEHISSGLQRKTSRDWFQGSLLKAGNPRTNFINLATALHRDALAVQLLTAPGWTSRRFSSIEQWPTNAVLWDEWETIYCDARNRNAKHDARAFYDAHREEMNAGSVVLWPAEEDLYTLMQMRVESGRTAFEREKQGSPIDPDVCEWPESYFEDRIWFDEWPSELAIRAIALDPSKGRDAHHGDYSAYALVGIDRDGVVYIEADLARRPTPQMVAEGVALCQRFRPDAFGVEANQFQELLCDEFARELKRQGMQYIVPAAIHNTVKKQVRIRRLGPYLSQRRLQFLSRSVSTQLLVDQLRDFPAGAHDDGPDALEMALRLADEVWHGKNTSDGLGNRLPVE